MAFRLLATSLLGDYAPVAILLLIAVAMAGGIVLASHLIGKHRRGEVKDSPYESGMPVIGNARRRFNVKFYIVAMLFLLFDVEVVFMWPWAPLFYKAATSPDQPATQALLGDFGKGFLLVEMLLFLAILLVGYVYAWRKGVFRWS